MTRARADGSGPAASAERIYAMVLRHVFLLRTSWPRIFEIIYWPTIQMILWGFITIFLATNSSYIAGAAGVLITGVLLWDVLFRGQLGFSLPFLEEIWSRNLGNLWVSPLRLWEYLTALTFMSLLRTLIGVLPAAGLAIVLYHVSVFDLGLPLLAFFTCLLVLGWSAGMVVTAMILRFGQGIESLAWLAVFMIAPVSAIYYPVSVLPDWLQPVAWALPTAPVFEGMRAILVDGAFRADLLIHAVLLDLVYLALGIVVFVHSFRIARRRGLLLQVGE